MLDIGPKTPNCVIKTVLSAQTDATSPFFSYTIIESLPYPKAPNLSPSNRTEFGH